jgi:hypothetical protein
VRLEENTLSIVVLGALLDFFFSLSFCQLVVTSSWSGGSVVSFRAFLVQVAAPAPQTTGRLLTVCPDVAELLAVVSLC